MNKASALFALALLALALPAGAVVYGPGDQPQTWQIDGTLSVSLEQYEIDGDLTQSPFRSDGLQSYGQLDLNIERSFSAYNNLRFHVLGLSNDSDYRSSQDGTFPERLNLVWQNGAARVPFRLELGDAYAYFSQRTVQRAIKGGQFEVQSTLGRPDRMHSLQLMAGSFENFWEDVRADDNFVAGASWLFQDPLLGSWSVNYLRHIRAEDRQSFILEREQRMYTVAAEIPMRLGSELVTLSGEAGRVEQDFSGNDDPRLSDTTKDEGYFVQLYGRGDHPLTYRLRYEDYGVEYRPAGSPVLPDCRAAEFHLGWSLPTGARLRGRYLNYRDDRTTEDPLDTETIGLSLSGPIFGKAVQDFSVYLDAFQRTFESSDLSTDSRVTTVDMQLNKSFNRRWTPSLRFFWQDVADNVLQANDSQTTEITFSLARAVNGGGFSGSIAPGILWRTIDSSRDATDDWQPTLDFNLSRGNHTLVQSVGFYSQDRQDIASTDVETLTYRGLYRWRDSRYGLTLGFETFDRHPKPGEDTTSYRATLLVSYHFDYYSRRARTAPTVRVPQALGDDFYLSQLVPGQAMDDVRRLLKDAGLGTPQMLGNVSTWETGVIDQIFQRQRLVTIADAGALERSAIIIEPESLGSPAAFLEEFERIRQLFLNRYGRPTNLYDDGEIGPDVRASVNSGRFFRLVEWKLSDGSWVRFGIPQRLDGAIRFELQHAADLPSPQEPNWSIDDARR